MLEKLHIDLSLSVINFATCAWGDRRRNRRSDRPGRRDDRPYENLPELYSGLPYVKSVFL